MAGYLERRNSNTDGAFATSAETDATIDRARRAAADFVGAEPDEVVFGPNMTTLSFALARSLTRLLRPGDEVVVTRLDHDANISPWLLAAEDSGATVRWVDLRPDDCTLDLDSLDAAVGPRTKIVAFTLASNATGTITAATEIVRRGRSVGAIVVADAVHLAQHRALDFRSLDVDVLFCSPYKFFGPHLGMMVGRRELLSAWPAYRVRPSSDEPPGRWETGTMNHEALAGLEAAVGYVADLGREFGSASNGDRRSAVLAGMRAVAEHESGLSERFLLGARDVPGLRLFGIRDVDRIPERTPTFAARLGDQHPRDTAEALGRGGVFVWDGNYYALAVMDRLGLEETGGAVRIGFCHYHTIDEVDRVLAALSDLSRPLPRHGGDPYTGGGRRPTPESSVVEGP